MRLELKDFRGVQGVAPHLNKKTLLLPNSPEYRKFGSMGFLERRVCFLFPNAPPWCWSLLEATRTFAHCVPTRRQRGYPTSLVQVAENPSVQVCLEMSRGHPASPHAPPLALLAAPQPLESKLNAVFSKRKLKYLKSNFLSTSSWVSWEAWAKTAACVSKRGLRPPRFLIFVEVFTSRTPCLTCFVYWNVIKIQFSILF